MHQFAEDGRLTGDIEFMVVGDSRMVGDVLNLRGLGYMFREQHADGCFLTLFPPAETSADTLAAVDDRSALRLQTSCSIVNVLVVSGA